VIANTKTNSVVQFTTPATGVLVLAASSPDDQLPPPETKLSPVASFIRAPSLGKPPLEVKSDGSA